MRRERSAIHYQVAALDRGRGLARAAPPPPRLGCAYVKRAFRTWLSEVRPAMEHLVASHDPYERTRGAFAAVRLLPRGAQGARGWDARDELHVGRIAAAAAGRGYLRRRSPSHPRRSIPVPAARTWRAGQRRSHLRLRATNRIGSSPAGHRRSPPTRARRRITRPYERERHDSDDCAARTWLAGCRQNTVAMAATMPAQRVPEIARAMRLPVSGRTAAASSTRPSSASIIAAVSVALHSRSSLNIIIPVRRLVELVRAASKERRRRVTAAHLDAIGQERHGPQRTGSTAVGGTRVSRIVRPRVDPFAKPEQGLSSSR